MSRRTPRRSLALGCVALLAGCGGEQDRPATPRTVTATALPPRKPPVRDAPIADGRRVFERSGCLACHQMGTRGNPGPGSNLTGIGARRSRAELREALLDPPSPMPSYRDLPRASLDDLVAYLSALRDNPPAGPACPDGSDCG